MSLRHHCATVATDFERWRGARPQGVLGQMAAEEKRDKGATNDG